MHQRFNATAANGTRLIGAAMLVAPTANLRISYNWRSDYEGTLDNHSRTSIDAFGVLDASVTYKVNAWNFALSGTNLTDEDAYSHTFAVVPNSLGGTLWKFATPRVPRNYGLQVTYEFGR